MQLKEFRDGLAVFARYYDDPEGYNLGAEHDIIYVYPTDTPLTEEDLIKVHSLGFFQPEVEVEDEWSPENYDPAEGWGAFV